MNYMEKGRSFGPGEYFTMVSHDYLEQIASNPDTPTDVRLTFLVMARVNSIGHAEFKMGELTRALGAMDADGVIQPMSNQGATKAIKRLVDSGVFKSGSVRCIQVSTYGIKREGQGSSSKCGFCGIEAPRRVRRKNPDVLVPKSRVKEVRREVEESKAQTVPSPERPEEQESLSTALLGASKVVPSASSDDPWDMPAPVTTSVPKPRWADTPEPEEEEPSRYTSLPRLSGKHKAQFEDDRNEYEKGSSLFDALT